MSVPQKGSKDNFSVSRIYYIGDNLYIQDTKSITSVHLGELYGNMYRNTEPIYQNLFVQRQGVKYVVSLTGLCVSAPVCINL